MYRWCLEFLMQISSYMFPLFIQFTNQVCINLNTSCVLFYKGKHSVVVWTKQSLNILCTHQGSVVSTQVLKCLTTLYRLQSRPIHQVDLQQRSWLICPFHWIQRHIRAEPHFFQKVTYLSFHNVFLFMFYFIVSIDKNVLRRNLCFAWAVGFIFFSKCFTFSFNLIAWWGCIVFACVCCCFVVIYFSFLHFQYSIVLSVTVN